MNAVMGTERFRHIAVLLASVCILLIGIGAASAAHAADSVEYLDPADPDERQSVEGYTVLTNDSAQLSKEWYVVREDIEFTDRVIINSPKDKSVNLVLCDGVTMTAPQGIQVTSGNSLTIWAQSDGEGMGELNASVTDSDFAAAIGGGAPAEAMEDATTDPDAGTITINGGRISAVSAASEGSDVVPAAAIGAGRCWEYPYVDGGSAGYISINGGNVTAKAIGGGAGIGHMIASYNRVPEDKKAGTITISGGTVTASGLFGLGGPGHAPAAKINIRGGEIIAESQSTVDEDAVHGNVDISGGTLTAIAGSGAGSTAFMGETGEAADSITLGQGIMVTAGDTEASAAVKPVDQRIGSLWSVKWARTEVCDHDQVEITGQNEQEIAIRCDYCGVEGTLGRPSLEFDCSTADTSMGKNPIYYANGEAISPDVTVTSSGTKLIEDENYEISYQDLISKEVCNKPAAEGSYKMIVSGKGMYDGLIKGEQSFFIRAETPEKGMIVFWSCNNDEADPCQIRIVGEGDLVGDIEQPSFAGHEFRGWYTDESYTEESKFDITKPVDMADWETKELNVYAKWDHNWGETTYEWKEDNSEVTASRTCRRCNNVESEIAQTTSSVTKEATCEDKGETTYTAVFESEAFTKQERTETDIDALGHLWSEWTTDKVATETEAGEMSRVCKRDPEHHVDTKIIPPIGHTHVLSQVEEKKAKCEEPGEMAHYECDSCGCLFTDAEGKEQITGKDLMISATGHKRGTPEKGEVKQATCQFPGGYNLTTRCADCGTVLAVERVVIPMDPDAHTWDEGKITKEPTEKENGIRTFTCTGCGETKTEEISKADYDRAGAKAAAAQSIAKAKAIKAGTYSARSYAAMTNALKALEKILANDNASAAQIKKATQTLDKAIKVLKKDQKLTVKKKTIKVKFKKVRKKARTVKPLTVKGVKTKVTYKGVGLNKKSKKALKINKKTGKITVRKKTKKGTYKMKVTITAAASAGYEAAKKTVTVKIRVR